MIVCNDIWVRDTDMDFCERLLLRWEHIHDTKDRQAAEYFLKHLRDYLLN